MFLTYTMLVVAIALSAVAAFYSIVGLTAIFAAAVVPIVIMGTILEIAKVVVTVWLHEYWRQCRLLMKIYLVPAVFVLMVITSMGIFGFLSKAHLDQTVPTGDVAAQVQLIDEKINNERDTIANARSLLAQLDKAVVDISNAPDREVNGRVISSAERALQVRRQQARDRANLTKTIEQAQARIVTLQEEKAPFARDLRKIEAEVGPIKYIAALIYGDNPDANLLEKAVRWVIIILVAVFDPLAIMMLLAATESHKWTRQRREEKPNDSMAPVLPADHGVAPDSPGPVSQDHGSPGTVVPPQPQETDVGITSDITSPAEPAPPESQAYLYVDPSIQASVEQPSAVQASAEPSSDQIPPAVDEDQPDHGDWQPRIDFGTVFPENPRRGDLFVYTGEIPTKLFKFNDRIWIVVDKEKTDVYSHNDAYVDFLIQSISRGEYDPDLLTQAERAEIESRLRREM